jgi:hypothetical protein
MGMLELLRLPLLMLLVMLSMLGTWAGYQEELKKIQEENSND